MVEVLSEHVQRMAVETEAKTSRTVGTVVQQLEKEITAAATSAAAIAEVTTRTVVEGVRRDVQAQIDQNRADTLRKTDEAQCKLDQVSNELKELTTQLNAFKPASTQNVDIAQKKLSEDFQNQLAMQNKVSEDVQQKLVAQTVRIDQLSETVNQSQKTAQDNADILQTLLVGMENLGEHFKQLQADLEHWKSPAYQDAEREYAEMNQNLLQEVSLSVPAVSRATTSNWFPKYLHTSSFYSTCSFSSFICKCGCDYTRIRIVGSSCRVGNGYGIAKATPGCPYSVSEQGI